MYTTTVDTTGNYRLQPNQVDPKDNLVKIVAGSQAVVKILAPLNWLISGQKTATLQNSQYVVIQKNDYNRFEIVQGNFLATTPLNTNTIPYQNVTDAPGPLTPIYFNSIAEQNTYLFDGTVTAYNPDGIDLNGYKVTMFVSNGLIQTYGATYTFDYTTIALTIIGRVFDGVPYILFYQ